MYLELCIRKFYDKWDYRKPKNIFNKKVSCWNALQVKKLSQWVIILFDLLYHMVLSKFNKEEAIWKPTWYTNKYKFLEVIPLLSIVL